MNNHNAMEPETYRYICHFGQRILDHTVRKKNKVTYLFYVTLYTPYMLLISSLVM